MKSNICKIEKGTRDLDAILNESERVAAYNGLSHKQSLQLRLLCEEIDGMLPNIIDDFDGELCIECEEGVCKVNIVIYIPEINADKKTELISIAKSKKNSAAVGIVGKIRNAIENFFLDEVRMEAMAASAGSFGLETGYSDSVGYSYLWRLEGYRNSVKNEDKAEEWDELEKSVIASVADDVIVGVKGRQANIIVVKKFA
jgi:hypothetical protein